MNDRFASHLRETMAARHLKQVDLVRAAQKAGVKLGKSHVSQYVAGKTVPRTETLNFLAEVLDVDPDWLVGNTEHARRHDAGDRDNGRQPTETSDATIPHTSATSSETASSMPDLPQHSPHDHPSATTTPTNPTSTNQSATNIKPEGATMRRFNKSTKLDNVLYDVRGPVVDEAARMEQAGMHVMKLNIGNPAPFGFRTPDEVVYDMSQQLTETEGYSASKGLFSARKAIMQYAQLKNLPNVGIEDVYTGNGVSELINLCMSALLDNGDEVLIPSPDYPLWTACVNLAGGTAVHYVCDEQSEWYPDIDDMRAKITDRTVAIVLINPNNPTGALYPPEVLQQIVDLAREHQLMIFSDEIYDRLVMDGLKHVSIASMAPDLFCVTFSGLSKSHMIAGYRIGWMVLSGNKSIAKDYIEGINMLTNMRICSNVPAQSIVQTALGGHQSVNDYIVPGGRIYEQRDYIYNALNSIPGVTAVKPKAAFYIFPKLDVEKFNITDDEQFALDLLHDKRILITRGGGFNWHEPDHFRIVYLPRIEVLKDAVDKLTDFLSYYRQ
ncbi:aminotransferase class I/II-fold pyridoxal phosphate-dependent enzyme [Bifidobacterium leontopitheci]|uniref:alanine transaminase n=1 Tax=Bifidobacterium leontopitheci TaxID=2650774 RepID=A0A6I1GKI9_9BIFI|nr:aminotransferase class I/II-fold pyridoxal phosphate-dependent enzyme [Bifidobacterium leontopitheci]KAB7791292.1 Aminotransferase [Bifidobacterium leontopitheci]